MLAFYWTSQNSGPDTQFKETIKPYSINDVKECSFFFLTVRYDEILQPAVHDLEFMQPFELKALLNAFFTFY